VYDVFTSSFERKGKEDEITDMMIIPKTIARATGIQGVCDRGARWTWIVEVDLHVSLWSASLVRAQRDIMASDGDIMA